MGKKTVGRTRTTKGESYYVSVLGWNCLVKFHPSEIMGVMEDHEVW